MLKIRSFQEFLKKLDEIIIRVVIISLIVATAYTVVTAISIII